MNRIIRGVTPTVNNSAWNIAALASVRSEKGEGTYPVTCGSSVIANTSSQKPDRQQRTEARSMDRPRKIQ